MNGHDITKQFFASSDDWLRLVRLENEKGEIAQNEYIFDAYEIGLVRAESPRIQAAITHLSESDDKWIAEAAARAARGPRELLLQ